MFKLNLLKKMNVGMMIFKFIFCSLLFISSAFADELGHLSLSASTAQTSDDLSLKTYGLEVRSNRRNLVYPYENSKSEAWDLGARHSTSTGSSEGLHFSHSFTEGFVGKKLNNRWYLEVGSGVSNLESDQDNDSFSTFSTKLEYSFEQLYFRSRYGHEDTILDMRYPRAISSYLKSHKFENTLLWTPGKYRAKYLIKKENLSDGNSLTYQDLELKYNLSRNSYWILAGFGFEKYSNSKQSSGYWTPEKFISYGPRFEITGPAIKSSYFHLALNLNRFKDENEDEGNGYYLNVGIQSAERNENHFKIGYERVKSNQGRDYWSVGRPYLNYNYFW
ncbi:MAG: hypothetical protein KC478_08815 [Bacteriovoracaceae bacterium]|nr:hypothetical protein [Bacteriovoracaceae bacterium]